MRTSEPRDPRRSRGSVASGAGSSSGPTAAPASGTSRWWAWLGLTVVAEGVEEAVQLDYLRENGCDFIQGYYYSRPLPLAALRDWLAERPLTATVTTA